MLMIECLKQGNIKINSELKQLEIADGQLIYPFDKIKGNEWGFVYEKFVGQILEGEGFKVIYNGFNGYTDGGIDLITEKGNTITFIQCKYSQTKKLSKSHINNILFKASRKLFQAYKNKEKQLAFALIVHCTKSNFRRAPLKEDPKKREYPWLDYFKSQDGKYKGLRVGLREIAMHT
ncbi:restriction endonuclease [Pontibacter sp. 172403-2]|uniref:restriction endonuclease n=1 Tax=Pontibacter rufus TaxID=2791028 RepID=UPI0018B0067E|nr:restriction endonuclease [Pontibacter sp. 172403-2]MBF9253000.1 restriction endonuclease [Pontibacter sp. 172403-2]